MGLTPEVINSINYLGIQSVLLGIMTTSGSIFAVYLLEKNKKFINYKPDEDCSEKNEEKYSILPVVISLAAGVVLGIYFLPVQILQIVDVIVLIALYIMVLGIGIDLGNNKRFWQEIRIVGYRIFILPFVILSGSLAGGVIAGIILGIPVNISMGIASGVGFYSITGPIISDISTVKFGTIGFLANLFREIFTFVIMPIVAKNIGKLSALATGGATTMDTTLPIVIKSIGKNYAVIAVISGMILTAFVPILVPFFVNL
jgi:uncharacterized membrane protein YbjE (DUF340 family)